MKGQGKAGCVNQQLPRAEPGRFPEHNGQHANVHRVPHKTVVATRNQKLGRINWGGSAEASAGKLPGAAQIDCTPQNKSCQSETSQGAPRTPPNLAAGSNTGTSTVTGPATRILNSGVLRTGARVAGTTTRLAPLKSSSSGAYRAYLNDSRAGHHVKSRYIVQLERSLSWDA